MILLALNCGFGQSDIASLPRSAVDLENAVIDFPRPKTATARRCPLWPETVDALRDALAGMPKAKSPADAKLVFITKYGSPWVRTVERKNGSSAAVDAVALETTKLLNRLKLKRAGSFYGLRHTFRTVADASKDQPAIDWIMGHVRDDMASEHYRHEISDERLRAVTELVQQWLFPKPKPAPKRKAK
jgi:integrase